MLTFKREEDGQTTIFVLGRKWSDLSQAGKIGTVLLACFQVMLGLVKIGLLVAALRDLHRRPPDLVNGNKRVWTFLVFINFVGPIAYFIFGRKAVEG
jgi:hypothetical protein